MGVRTRPCSREGIQGCGKCAPCKANWKRAVAPRQPDTLPRPTLRVVLSVDRDTRGRGPLWVLTGTKLFAAQDHRPDEMLRRGWGWPSLLECYQPRG